MELLKVTEPMYSARWDGTAALNYLHTLSQDLQDAYTFTSVLDDLAITGGDGTSSIAFSGSIKLYIDNATYIQLILYKYGTSASIGIKIDLINSSGSITLYYKETSSAVGYYAHAIWETETNQIIVSCTVNENILYCTPLSRGLCFMIGTSTNQYTNISIPTVLALEQSTAGANNSEPFKTTSSTFNRITMANNIIRTASVVQLPVNISDLAVLYPIVSPSNHYIMDNILVSSLIPTCFSDTYSAITYRGHQYAQFGRYLLLDEDTSQQGE